jgi:ABC-type branched-subunit amino acid transport system substrate-binding protein
VVESGKKEQPLVEKKKVNENFSKEEVLKQKITLKKSESIPKKINEKVTFEFRTERLLQGRNPKDILQKEKTNKAILAVKKMLKQNLSVLDKNINIKNNKTDLITDPYIFGNENYSINKNILALLPLTGKYSQFGRDIRKALDLSLLQTAPKNFQIIYYDTGKEIHLEKIKYLKNLMSPKIIIGPFTRETLLKVKTVIKEKPVPVITFTNDIAMLENNIWSLGFSPEEQIESVVSCALKNRFKRFGLIVPSNLYGKIIIQSSSDIIKTKKSYYMEDLSLTNNEVNNKTNLFAKLKTFLNFSKDEISHSKFDAILLAGGKDFILEIAPLLAFFNVDSKSVQILGTEIFNYKDIRNEPSLENSWFPVIYSKDDDKYKQVLKDTWNTQSNYFSKIGFDAGLLAINFLKLKTNDINYFYNAKSPLVGFVFKNNGQVKKPTHIMQIDNLGKLSNVKGCESINHLLKN